PLHAAAHYLNPSIFYNPGFATNPVIQKGLLDCIEGLELSLTAQDMITRQKTSYGDAVGDFSRPVAIRGQESLAQLHGGRCMLQIILICNVLPSES
ncbi:hypothetical protein MKX01_021946, partial [Papaver californicum]